MTHEYEFTAVIDGGDLGPLSVSVEGALDVEGEYVSPLIRRVWWPAGGVELTRWIGRAARIELEERIEAVYQRDHRHPLSSTP